MKEIHEIQRKILLKLLFSQGLKYTELKPDPEMENSQFDFHVKTLIDQGYIIHISNIYSLTTIGKEYANRYDSDSGKYKKQAKISVWVAVTRRSKTSDENEYLIGTRLKNPFYGAQGFLAGKLDYGETIYDGAKREMKEETNLEGQPTLIHIRHYINRQQDTKEVIEDKFLYFFQVKEPTGDLQQNYECNFAWVKESEFQKQITKPFDSYPEFLEDINIIKSFNGTITFCEKEKFPDNF